MKKIYFLFLILSLVFTSNINAQFKGSIAATSFSDATALWVTAPGFHYSWNKTIPTANMYSNERNTLTIHITGFEECVNKVKVSVGRLSFTSWTWKDVHNYYADGTSDHPALIANDFTNGQIRLDVQLPAGMKPYQTYTDFPSGEFCPWTVQVSGVTSTCTSETYMNFVMDVSEEISGTTAINDLEQLDNISVYPNPVSKGSQLTVDATAFSSEVTIEIYNVAGSKVYTTTAEPAKVPVDSSLLSSGLYTVVVSSAENVAIAKVIVK